MYYDNTNDLIDLIDLLNFTLHEDFVSKWRHKYSEKFITVFQYKLLDSLNKRKPLNKLISSNSKSGYLTSLAFGYCFESFGDFFRGCKLRA